MYPVFNIIVHYLSFFWGIFIALKFAHNFLEWIWYFIIWGLMIETIFSIIMVIVVLLFRGIHNK